MSEEIIDSIEITVDSDRILDRLSTNSRELTWSPGLPLKAGNVYRIEIYESRIKILEYLMDQEFKISEVH